MQVPDVKADILILHVAQILWIPRIVNAKTGELIEGVEKVRITIKPERVEAVIVFNRVALDINGPKIYSLVVDDPKKGKKQCLRSRIQNWFATFRT